MIESIQQLRTALGAYSFDSILGYSAWFMNMDLHVAHEETGLTAPQKLCMYAIGLTLTTSEPATSRRITMDGWKRLCRTLSQIYALYGESFGEYRHDSEYPLDDQQHRAVTTYFLHHHGAARVTGVDQIIDRIENTLVPFDSEIKEQVGISASEALRVVEWMNRVGQADLDYLHKAVRENRLRIPPEQFFSERPDWLVDRAWHAQLADRKFTRCPIPQSRATQLFTFSLDGMSKACGEEVASAFATNFSSARDGLSSFVYLTDENPAERRPLFRIDNGQFFYPHGRSIHNAILDGFTSLLMSDSVTKERFLRRRDQELEKKVHRSLRRFFPVASQVFTNCFDAKGNEHDIVVFHGGALVAVEVKASPPTEPFREPEKAWTRIARHFHSNRGIQKAFEQARSLVRLAELGEGFRLYDEERNLLVEIPPKSVTTTFSICVTSENHGPVATDLSLLLKRDPDDEYPWAVSAFELETILDGFEYVGIGAEDFLRFLAERRRMHGRVFPYDESEMAGIFLRYRSLMDLLSVRSDALVVLAPQDGAVFDEIFMERLGRGVAVTRAERPYKLNLLQKG